MADLTPPNRSVVLAKLAALAAGELSRDEAYEWAKLWVLADTNGQVDFDDIPALEGIVDLMSANLQSEPGKYLYGPLEFHEWFEELRSSPLPAKDASSRR